MKKFLLKTWLTMICLLVGAGTMWAETVTKSISDVVSENSYTVSSGSTINTKCTSIDLDANINVSVAVKDGATGNTGTFWGTAPIDWRLYQADEPTITVSAADGYTISTVKFTYSNSNTGVINTSGHGQSIASTYRITSGTAYEVNATSATYYVGNTSTKSNGQARITAIEVVYSSTSGGGSTPTTYNVTVANDIANGTVTTDKTTAAAGATVTLTATPADGYEFGEWNVTNASTSAAITVTDNKFTMPAANVNVSATFNAIQSGSGDGTWTKCSISDLTSSDIFVIVDANSGTAMTNNNGTSSAPAATTVTISADGNTITGVTDVMKWNISGNGTNGYTFNPNGSTTTWLYCTNTNNGVRVGTNTAKTFTLDGKHLKHAGTSRYVGVYNNSDWRCYTSNSGNIENTDTKFYKYVADGGTPEPPTGDPQISNFIKTANLNLETGADPYDVRNALNIPNDYDQDTYAITTTINGLTQKDGEYACAYPYLSFQKAGSYTVNVTAAAMPGKYAETSGNISVTVTDPVNTTYASLEELVAADLASGTEVTVSFENVAIKSFQTVSGTRKGVYFDIQKGGKDIEIYFNSAIPAEWAVGGTLSGTMTNCPWKLYSGTWELAPASGWAWTNLTYNAPANYAPAITTQPVSATYEFNASAANLTVAASGNPAPTYQWYSNTTNSNENGTILTGETNASYKPSTATAGTFYYYCVATNSEGSATSNVATITVNEPKVAALPFSFDGGVSDIASKDGMSQSGLGSDYSSSPKLKFDTQGDNVIINFNEAAKKVTYTIKGNSTSGTYAFDVMESADGVEYTTVHSHTSISDATSYTDNLSSTSRFVKFVYTTKVNGNVALGNISIIAASIKEEPNLAFDKATYKFIAGKEMQVTATSKAGSTGAITYALTEGDEEAFLIDENTGYIVCETAGTYTVTATIAENADYYSRSTTCTVNVLEPIVGNSIIVAETDDGYYAMTTTCDGSYFGYQAIKKAGDKYVVNSLDDILFYTSTADGKTTIQSIANNEYVQSTAAKNISYTENEYKWTNDGEKLTAANNAYGTLQYNTSSPRFTTYTSKVGQYATIVDLEDVIVGDVVTLVATDGENYYATFSSTKDVEFVDAEVYTVTVADDALTLTEVTGKQVPAGKGVLIKSAKTKAAYINADGADALGDNMLVACTETGTCPTVSGTNSYYKLAYGDNTNKTLLGFWWGAEGGSNSFNVKAGGAVLVVPQAVAANLRGFSFGDVTTGINVVETTSRDVIFNLQGQRINRLQQGVNIVNGKKVLR